MDIPQSSFNDIKPNTRICVIADYPSHQDLQMNQGYSDSAGSILAQCVGHAGISMAEISLIFVIPVPCSQAEASKFWTPKGGFSTLATHHFSQLQRAIKEANANVYVPLGEIALQALTTKKGITKWRGSILSSQDFYGPVKIIPTIDPRTALRQYLYRYFISADFKRIHTEGNTSELCLTARNLVVQPDYNQAKSFLEMCLDASVVAVDIEVYKKEVSCISFAISAEECMSIPFDERWSMLEEMTLWRLVAKILESETIEKVFQNGMFDMSFLFFKNKILTRGFIHDTMVKHNLNYPDFPKNLGFITSLYTREPYYKDEGKTWFNDLKGGTGDIAQFYLYNAKDSAVCFEANEPIAKELTRFGNDKTYLFNERLFRPLLYMQARGILVDEDKLAAHRVEARKQRDALQETLNKLVGFSLNVSSPKQCKTFFYTTKGYPPQTKKVKDKDTGVHKQTISCDDKAMKRLIRRFNSEEAKLVTSIRKYRKLIGTYLEVQYDTDKRLRCSFNMAGTNTGRLSSSETIFGTGTNMQNLPKAFKEFLVADPGMLICDLDKAQAEWVAVAYIAGEARMIEAVESGIDVHIHTAHLMFGIPKDLIEREAVLLDTSTDEDWIHEQRLKDIPEILTYRNLLPNMSCRQAGKKCLIEGTEVLTQRGWIRIEYLESFDKVAQWENEVIKFVQPSEYFQYFNNENLIELSANHVHQIVTPEHKLFIRKDPERNGIQQEFVTAALLDNTRTHWNLPTSGRLFSNTKSAIGFSPAEMQLLVALQADGTIDTYGSIIFKFEKVRKIERLKSILNSLELRYTNTEGYFFIHNTNSLVTKLVYFLTGLKNFGAYLLSSPLESLEAFIKEVVLWDGYAPKKQYFSTNKNNADWVQTIAHLTGRRGTIKISEPKGFGKKLLYWVQIGKSTGTSLVSIKKREIKIPGNVYCLTVDSGLFLMRSHDKISVTGNSNHSFNYGLSANGFAIQYNLELRYAKQCYQLYHNAYPGLTLWHQHIRNKLSKDRTLENLFGRKRRFLNRWNEDLFKAAYSYIPQSTVGQLLNIGIVETYYQQDREGLEFLKKWDLLNQVHDSMVFQYPANDPVGFAKTIKQIQENLNVKMYANGREFIIKTDGKIGLNCKKLYTLDIAEPTEEVQKQIENLIANQLAPKTEEITINLDELEDEDSMEEDEEL